jgi:IS30 family transposase
VTHRKPQPWAPRHTLTPNDVVEIRRSRLSLDTLARQFGVHRRTISRVVARQTWKAVA